VKVATLARFPEVVVMRGILCRRAIRAVTLAAVIALLGAAGTPAEAGRPREPFLDIHSAGRLAPDGQSVTVDLLWSCPLRWTVVEAVVVVSQPQASGQASVPLTCIDQVMPVRVTVQSSAGTFQLGDAQVNASVLIRRGHTQRVEDAEVVDLQPSVFVDLADTARLESGGGAVVIDVTVACPVGANGQPSSYVNVSQGQASGAGNYVPVCDGTPHTLSVTVPAVRGVYQPGAAQALTFADVEHRGCNCFSGFDEGAVQIVT
jgi:hypothetical protein